MAGQQKSGSQMGVGGSQDYGKATGKPASTGKIKYGDDLRNGGGSKK
jgi:hypothetical protein